MLAAMQPVPTLYLCLGSACHQRRGYQLLPLLEALIQRHGLAGRLELRGAFCLNNCQHGSSLKFGDRIFSGVNEQRIAEIFEREILPHCQPT
jgi:NADH:ubiquinone oxidoreductase subunit E